MEITFSDTIIFAESPTCYSIYKLHFLGDMLLPKKNYFERYEGKFSHISEMNITFISHLRNMTYEHYLQQPKSMLEWKLNVLLAKNPQLIKSLTRYHILPLIRKYRHINEDDGEN